MKSIFRYIIFSVLAVSAVFAACSKDTVVESNPDAASDNLGLRTITLSFSSDTKVAFSGTKAEFQNGDMIKVANATESKNETVNVSGGIASITTSLTGPLTAVFPSTAANVTGNGPLESPQFKVKAQQNGTSRDAVIAVAQIEGMNAVFELKTALFEITPPSTAKQIIIKSLSPVMDGVARTGTAADINTDGTEKTIITVGDGSANLPNPIYVALVPGVNLTDLSFDAGEAVGMKGIPENKLGTTPNATVARGKYTIDNTNWHPYVEIGGLKWATRNIGATADTGADSYGTYFSWGSVDKVYTSLSGITSSSTFTFGDKPSDARYTGTWTANSGFAACNTPYYDNSTSSYGTYTSSDGKAVLELADDAAYVNWGGPWRMPTGGTVDSDFTVLANACRTDGETERDITSSHNEPTSKGVHFYPLMGSTEKKGLYFIDGDGNKLFFPATGYGKTKTLTSPDIYGYYWSSNLCDTDNKNGYLLKFSTSAVNLYNSNREVRYTGCTIRPVAD